DPDGYAALDQLASAVPPGSRGLVAELARADAWTLAGWHPPFRPQPPGSERPAGPGARAAATGDADGLGARARGVEDAAAHSARRSADILPELLGVRLREAILTGGAARSTLWPQILADVLGLAVHVPAVTESAAAGAAAVAGLAVGVRPAAAEASGPAPPRARVAQPTPARRRVYDELYDQGRMAYDRPGLARDGRSGR